MSPKSFPSSKSFFTTSAGFLFLFSNFVRIVTGVGLIMGLVTEGIVIGSNISLFRYDSVENPSSPSSKSTNIINTHDTRSSDGRFLGEGRLTSALRIGGRVLATGSEGGDCSNGGLVGISDVPDQTGGILFFILSAIFTMALLLLLLISEFPPPIRALTSPPTLLSTTFPLLTSSSAATLPNSTRTRTINLTFLGVLLISASSSLLSHPLLKTGNRQEFAFIAAWFLFAVGCINLVFLGLIPTLLDTNIRERRAVWDFISEIGNSKYKLVWFPCKNLDEHDRRASSSSERDLERGGSFKTRPLVTQEKASTTRIDQSYPQKETSRFSPTTPGKKATFWKFGRRSLHEEEPRHDPRRIIEISGPLPTHGALSGAHLMGAGHGGDMNLNARQG